MNGSQETVAVWLRMLDAVEAGAKSNKESIEAAAVCLNKATEQSTGAAEALSKATEALNANNDKLEDMVTLKMSMERVQGEIKELQDESKSQKVGKGDLLWKVLVGFFAIVASVLGTALISIVVKGQ